MHRSTVRQIPFWASVRAWWQEYFSDNPVVWLLFRQFRYELRRDLGDLRQIEQQLAQAQAAGDTETFRATMRALANRLSLPYRWRFWEHKNLFWGALFWFLCLSLFVMNAQFGWSQMTSQAPTTAYEILTYGLGILMTVLQGTLYSLFYREKYMGTLMFLRLTRLNSKHYVYASVIVNACVRFLKIYLLGVLPITWFLLMLRTDHLFGSFYGAIVVGWVWWSFAVLWGVWGALLVARRSTALSYASLYTSHVIVLLLLWFSGVFLFILWEAWNKQQSLTSVPIWMWVLRREWWVSLHPSVANAALPHVWHPIWGWGHGLIYLGLARLSLPFALRRVQSVLNQVEETQESVVKGEWG